MVMPGWMGICLQMPGNDFPKEHNIASEQPLHSITCEFKKKTKQKTLEKVSHYELD